MVELPYLQYGFVLSVYEIVSFWVLVASIPNGKSFCWYDCDYRIASVPKILRIAVKRPSADNISLSTVS